MSNQYTLKQKINALDLLEDRDCDYQHVCDQLHIPPRTLRAWKSMESDLRRDYRGRLLRQFARLKLDLQVKMLERGLSIVDMLDEEHLQSAPLNQLATTLSALVNHALKLDEAIIEEDEQTEKVVRFEFVRDGQVTESPPWAGIRARQSSSIQDSSLRQTLGQDGTGQDVSLNGSAVSRDTWLVARADLSDGESGLAGFEDERDERLWYHD